MAPADIYHGSLHIISTVVPYLHPRPHMSFSFWCCFIIAIFGKTLSPASAVFYGFSILILRMYRFSYDLILLLAGSIS